MQVRLFFVFLLSIPAIVNANWVAPDHLNLRLYTADAEGNTVQPEVSWEAICPSWGEKLLHGQGPLGGGIFLHFSCYAGDRLLEGDRISTPWELAIRANKKGFSLTLSYEKEVLAQLKFSAISHPLSVLQDSEFSTYSLLYLLDSLPVFRRITAADIEKSNQLAEVSALDGIEAPTDITIYHLDLANGHKMVWRPQVLGQAARQDGDGTFSYRLEIPASKIDFSTPVWAHSQQGPGHLAALALPLAESRFRHISQSVLENIEEAFTSGLDKGYVGLRFGIPLINGTTLGTKTRFVGFVSEFRNGLLKGFSLFIDYWPTITNNVDGQTASFGGSREALGWTYSFSPIHRAPSLSFGLTPKVGAWNMKIVVPTGGKEVPFTVKNSLGLGFNVQTEYVYSPFLFRLYYERALSVKFAFQNTQVNVNRTGLDFHWGLKNLNFLPKSLGVSILGFAFDEIFTFSTNATQDAVNSQGVVITNLSYTQIYLGAGVALTW